MNTNVLIPQKAMDQSEKWHRENCGKGCLDKVKELLKETTKDIPIVIDNNGKKIHTFKKIINPIPILHNKGKIYLQFCGWSINLMEDGTWHWEDTTGG